jgi:hypothetical protein
MLAAIDAARDGLAGTRPATCLPAECFCEAVRSTGLAQPVNTLTSLAFVALGVWVVAGGVPPGAAADRSTRGLGRAVGVVLVLLGVGSAWYHGTLTFVGQVLDVQGMYLLGTLTLVMALVRRGHLPLRLAAGSVLTASAVLLAVQVAVPDSRRVLFGLVLLPGVLLETRRRTTGRPWRSSALVPMRVGLVVLAIAYTAWVLDDTGRWCWPTSPWQGHGLWHVLTAVAAVLLVPHYVRTPRPDTVGAAPARAA